MIFFKKVILFFVNIFWYINLLIHPFIKWGLSFFCVVNGFVWLVQDDTTASHAGMLTILSFVILVLSKVFISNYKPSNFSR